MGSPAYYHTYNVLTAIQTVGKSIAEKFPDWEMRGLLPAFVAFYSFWGLYEQDLLHSHAKSGRAATAGRH
jgi:hypothetical protein